MNIQTVSQKIQVCALFHARDIRRNAFLKFIRLCMETPRQWVEPKLRAREDFYQPWTSRICKTYEQAAKGNKAALIMCEPSDNEDN